MYSLTDSPDSSYVRLMMPSFDVTFFPSGKGWRATLVQTKGAPVLPAATPIFRGKSLASVEERISFYLSGLNLGDWVTSYDFGSVLHPGHLRLLNAAHDAMREAEAAEYRRIRLASQAIEELSDSGFSIRDITVLLGESKATVQRIRRDGELIQGSEDQIAANADSPLARRAAADLGAGPGWYSFRHADADLSPGAAIALEIGFEVMPETEVFFPHEVSLVRRLPDRFARRYDREFLAKFQAVLDGVFDAIRQLDVAGMSSTPAQEIALVVLIAAARQQILQLIEIGEKAGAREDLASLEAFREAVTEDRDVDFLWGHENDGLEEDTERMNELGIGKALLFENWFKPHWTGQN
jgi:hypothetical protein